MLVTKKKYDKLARDYRRLYWEYNNYIQIVNADAKPVKETVKKKPLIRREEVKEKTAKKVK
jgi:hypothetical protein